MYETVCVGYSPPDHSPHLHGAVRWTHMVRAVYADLKADGEPSPSANSRSKAHKLDKKREKAALLLCSLV